ncbi:MAG: AAA family ATPase [Candidatus Thorarchaeota archaeon]|nr:AAA family ATPase [Candidatus Thorarchaeota archaeon]
MPQIGTTLFCPFLISGTVLIVDSPLWCVKYRPDSWEKFVGQEQAISHLRSLATSSTYSNMIFLGPSGTGKTSAAFVFGREILGDTFATNFKHLNVRDLRYYSVAKSKRSLQALAKLDRQDRTELDEYMSAVFKSAKARLKAKGRTRGPNKSQLLQEAIRLFASTITVSDEFVKILVLDESDAMDMNMQQALRRTMEIYSDASRFIFITPSIAGWSPALISRSLVVRFPSPSVEVIESLVTRISKAEGVKIDEDAIAAIARESSGDMRRAINILQVAATGSAKVTEDGVYECSETQLVTEVRRLVTLACDGQFTKARKILRNLIAIEGHTPEGICLEIERDITRRPFDPATLSQILDRVATINHRMLQAKNPFIQLTALLASIGHVAASDAT